MMAKEAYQDTIPPLVSHFASDRVRGSQAQDGKRPLLHLGVAAPDFGEKISPIGGEPA